MLFSNLEFLADIVASPGKIIISLLDIVLVSWLIYRFIKSMVGTKIMSLVQGAVIFVLLRFLAELIGLTTITYLMNQVITYGVIAMVVIFAPEIRSFLEKMGRTPQNLLKTQEVEHEEKLVTALVDSVKYMSPRRIGALMSIEQTQTLREYMSTGIPLYADISSQLLINIFIPNTPLHDGAVIIKGQKVAVASSYLPLSESKYIAKEFGTRHRAAIGLSEVSDAVTIVVSEETGGISLTHKDIFRHDLSLEELEDLLRKLLVTESQPTDFWSRWKKGGKNHA